ncbi:MAG: glycerol kinase, partial [Acidimicrobiales bacterium]|nr:glycerol kinase [Acidimicrobiales bacterium]
GPHVAAGTIDTWLLWNLTGGRVHATDPSNASRTQLYDIGTLAWSDELCELFEVPRSLLPDLAPSSGPIGVTAAGLPIPAGTPITGIAGDQQAALFGQACHEPGMAKNTYGTGSFVLMNVGSTCPAPVEGLLTTVAWQLDSPAGAVRTDYALEGAIFATGAAVQWLRDGLGIIEAASDLETLALGCDDTDGVYLVPAFTGLGSPWWDPWARGTIVGLTRGSGRPQLARAVVDAMVHQTRDVVGAMEAASGHRVSSLRVDGGASVMDLLLRLQADQLGVTVVRPTVAETTAMGAAYLAGLGSGTWSGLDELASLWQADATVDPDPTRRLSADERHARWLDAVDRARSWHRA